MPLLDARTIRARYISLFLLVKIGQAVRESLEKYVSGTIHIGGPIAGGAM
jgi:hypothetical protein